MTVPNGLRGRTRTQVLALFGFVVLAFVVLAYRTETQAHDIKENQDGLQAQEHQKDIDRYVGCLSGVAILERFNSQERALAEIERTQTRKVNPALADARIHAYLSSVVVLPPQPCGKDPRKGTAKR